MFAQLQYNFLSLETKERRIRKCHKVDAHQPVKEASFPLVIFRVP